MNCPRPCQTEILADPQRSFSLSAGTQMQLAAMCVGVLFGLFVFGLWAVVSEGVLFCVYCIFVVSCRCVVSV